MKKKFIFIAFAFLLCLCFILSACGQNGSTDKNTGAGRTYFTVTFDSQGGSAVGSLKVLAGDPLSAPTPPTRKHYDFAGWYISANENACIWDFALDRVVSDITLYAHWTAKQDSAASSQTLTFEMGDGGYIVTGDKSQSSTIVIPEAHDGLPVIGIGESAFAYSRHTSDIISVTIPDSVTFIGLNAFHNRKKLEEVKISQDSRLRSIDNNAFSGNSALKAIYLPKGFESLGNDVFNNCGSLTAITVAAGNTHYSGEGNCLVDLASNTLIRGSNTSVIPNTVKTIGSAAFRKATLTTLTIPTSVTSIQKYAISDSSITKIIYAGTSAEWKSKVERSPYWDMGMENVKIECSDTPTSSDILVAYFSCTNRTKVIAQKIADATGGELYEIVPAQPYTEDDLNYGSSCRANDEQRSATARPEINGGLQGMENYDVIYLGYPIWWSKAPKIICTFLESYDFAGKTIIPFCTSGSSPIDGSLSEIKALTNNATWLGGRRFDADASQEVIKEWIDALNL